MKQRLFEITLLLCQRQDLTAGQLARRFGVSQRTIYRDIDALSLAGVPVYSEKGRGGGLRLLPGYVLDKTIFTREEQSQLTAYLGSLEALGAPDTGPLREKLEGLFGEGGSWLEVDFAPWAGGEEQRTLFRLVQGAILRRQVLRFEYSAAGGQAPERREVEPRRVLFRGQGWYLQAWCRLRRGWRTFKLNRIHDAVLTGEDFPPGRPDPPDNLPYDGPAELVRLWLAPGAGARVMDEFDERQVRPSAGGGYIVESTLPTGGGWLLGYILSYGAAARVLQPLWLRRAVQAELAALQASYEAAAGEVSDI